MRHASCLIGFLATLAICNADSTEELLKYEKLKHEPPWRISVVVALPYLDKTKPNPTTNEDFEGYIPDVLMRIGEQLHQRYIITPVPDGEYGNKIPGTNSWNGMIGELIDGKADLAATPLTVRSDRRELLDYTEPLFSVRCVVVMMKSSWRSMSLEELVEKTSLKFAIHNDRRIIQNIQNSTLPHFKKIAAALAADPDLLAANAKSGVEKVRNGDGKYAYITFSCNGVYYSNKLPCDLVAVETYLPQSDLALAVPKGSPIKERFNAAITHLREMEELVKIRKTYWKDECSSGILHTWGALIGLRLLSLVLAVAAFPVLL